MDVMSFLKNESTQSDFHDADTRWNALFPSQALISAGTTFLGSFRTGQYQGPNTTMVFANGTEYSQMNLAVVFGNFTGVDSGQAFFKQFCTGPKPVTEVEQPAPTTTVASRASSTPTATPTPSQVGYPKAVILNPNLSVGGYYINDTGYDVRLITTKSTSHANKFRMLPFSASLHTSLLMFKASKMSCETSSAWQRLRARQR